MEKPTLLRHVICLLALALSSCTSIQHGVARIQSSFVDEHPYSPPSSKKLAPPVKKTPSFRERLAQWAPTQPKASNGYTPFPTKPHSAAVAAPRVLPRPTSAAPPTRIATKKITPAPAPKKTAKRPAPKKASKALAPIDPIEAIASTPKRKPAAQTRTSSVNGKGKIYKVRYVPGRPTHIVHPTKRHVIVRITDKQGNKPPKGTIMRVPNEKIRFYIP